MVHKWLRPSPAIIKQTILSISVSLAYFCIGLVRGYSAPAVPSMNEISPGLIPNKDIGSWISAIPPFGAFIGSLVSAPLMHFIGRKYTVLISSPIWTISWITIAMSTHWGTIFAGRMLSGFCAGLTLPAAQIYVTESSDPKIRGIIGTIPSLSMSVGILVMYILGKYLTWNILAWTNCVIATSMFLAVVRLPESPVWLKSKKKYQRAKDSADWLHLEGFQMVAANSNEDTQKHFTREALLRREVLMPLGIGLGLLIIQQLSGVDVVIFFTVEIFRASGSSLESHVATIIVGLTQVLSNFSSLFFVDKYGRKPLLIVSGVVMSIAMASLGSSLYLSSIGNKSYGYLPILSIIVFMIGFSIGFGCIPFLLMGELFPTAQRGLLSSVAGSFNLAVMFIVLRTYHPIDEIITTAGTFWMYSILCAFGVLFVIFVVPETKGRELENIKELFIKKNKQHVTDAATSVHNNTAVTTTHANNPICTRDVHLEQKSQIEDSRA